MKAPPDPTLKQSLEPLTIPLSMPYLEKMTGMVHGADVLRKEGYRTEEFGEELSKLRRCGKCRGMLSFIFSFPSFIYLFIYIDGYYYYLFHFGLGVLVYD